MFQNKEKQSEVIAAGNLRSDVRCSCRGDQIHDCARFLVPKKIGKKFEKNSKVLQTRAASLARRSAVLALKVHCDFIGGLRKFEDVFEIGIALLCIVPKISLQLNLCCAAKFRLQIALTSGFLRF